MIGQTNQLSGTPDLKDQAVLNPLNKKFIRISFLKQPAFAQKVSLVLYTGVMKLFLLVEPVQINFELLGTLNKNFFQRARRVCHKIRI